MTNCIRVRLEQSKRQMDQNYREEANAAYYRGSGHGLTSRSQWDNWDGWNPNPCIDTGRNYDEWGQPNHHGILKQHSQDLQHFGSNGSIGNEMTMENNNRYQLAREFSKAVVEELNSNFDARYYTNFTADKIGILFVQEINVSGHAPDIEKKQTISTETIDITTTCQFSITLGTPGVTEPESMTKLCKMVMHLMGGVTIVNVDICLTKKLQRNLGITYYHAADQVMT